MLDRGDYWQCAFVIPKGGFERGAGARARGVPRGASRRSCRSWRTASTRFGDWDDVKLLTVAVDRLRQWYRPGLLCIGDAAHAMSPVGGVGINLAIQDAVAAANILSGPLARGACRDSDLARVQKRRELPTRVVQRVQLLAQDLFFEENSGRPRASEDAGAAQTAAAIPDAATHPSEAGRDGNKAGAHRQA